MHTPTLLPPTPHCGHWHPPLCEQLRNASHCKPQPREERRRTGKLMSAPQRMARLLLGRPAHQIAWALQQQGIAQHQLLAEQQGAVASSSGACCCSTSHSLPGPWAGNSWSARGASTSSSQAQHTQVTSLHQRSTQCAACSTASRRCCSRGWRCDCCGNVSVMWLLSPLAGHAIGQCAVITSQEPAV